MVSKVKEKTWFSKHPVISIIAIIFGVLLIIGGISDLFSSDSSNTETNNYQQTSTQNVDTSQAKCTPDWSCGSWSECSKSGTQTRTCTDSNNCGTSSGKPKTSQSCTPNKEWKDVTIFESSSSKKTETFAIKGEKWRFTWSCKKSNSYDGMNIGVYEPGNDVYTEFLFMQKCPDSEEVTYVYKGDAEYYFDIMIANVDSWKIKVEEWN